MVRLSTLGFDGDGICGTVGRKARMTRVYGRCLLTSGVSTRTVIICPILGKTASLGGKAMVYLLSRPTSVRKNGIS